MNRSYQIKREVLAADPMWSALPKCERDCALALMVGLFRHNLN